MKGNGRKYSGILRKFDELMMAKGQMDSAKILQKNIELWAKTCPKEAVMLPYVNNPALVDCRTKQGEANLRQGALTYHSQAGALEEALAWFKGLALKNVPFVCVYGVGLGYYYDAIEAWLKKDRHRHLVFIEDDLAVLHKLLETERGTRILQNQQVQLIYFKDLKADAVFEALYWNFSMTRLAVSALGGYAEHRQERFSQLRHKIAYDASMKNALVDEYLRYGVSYYLNFYRNMLCLPGSAAGNQFFGKFQHVPAIICGAGPSLAKNLALLGNLLDRAVVFAGGSALNVLNAGGFQPHFGVGIDPNPMQLKRLSESQGYEVPFFYRNRLYHEAFKLIHGPRLYITGAGGYDTAEFFDKKLHIHGEWLDEGHNVVNFSVEVAHAMGCNPIIFAGMDLAFTGMQGYAPGVVEDSSVSQSMILDVDNVDDVAVLRNDIYGQSTYTLWKWIAEADWIGDFAKEHPQLTMINATEGGLGFPGVVNQTLSEAAEKYLTRQYELKNRIHGETQNSAMPKVTYGKVAKIMKDLAKSLQQTVSHFSILQQEAQEEVAKIKEGKAVRQSGWAALAETELLEEPAYKHVIEVFNEVYTRILSGEVHELSVSRCSEKQRRLKKIALQLKKYAFLSDVSRVNAELIKHAFAERKAVKGSAQVAVEIPAALPGDYSFAGQRLSLHDPELKLNIDVEFVPVLLPTEKRDGQELPHGHRLKVFFDKNWKLAECYVEKKGELAGMLDGQCQLFYADGSLKLDTFYQNGKLHGPATFLGAQGQLLGKSWFIDGQQEGKSYWYYPSGALYSLQRYRKNLWHGRQEYYYADGALKTLMIYDYGRLVGKPTTLNADGTPAAGRQ